MDRPSHHPPLDAAARSDASAARPSTGSRARGEGGEGERGRVGGLAMEGDGGNCRACAQVRLV